jgi:hypothetical protein
VNRSERDRRIRKFILYSGTVIVLLFVFLDPIMRGLVKHDLAGARVQTGTGQIVTAVPLRSEDFEHPLQGHVIVRFRGKLFAPKTIDGLAHLRPGGEALVTYRIGKSGHVYVDAVGPLHPDVLPKQ